jgi:Tol biopolymer transport system component
VHHDLVPILVRLDLDSIPGGPYSKAMHYRIVALLLIGPGCAAPDRGAPGAAPDTAAPAADAAAPFPASPDEPHLANLRMLTRAGENAEAYFSADGTRLIFQATRPGESACDQIFVMDAAGANLRRVSNGEGRTTCGYFFPDGERILYSSTHLHDPSCPAPPDYSRGYVWALYEFDLFTARPDGSDIRRLTDTPGYDAEATISPDGSRIVFTSVRDGDLEIYTMDADGGNPQRLTHEPGYDGGAFFSPDGSRIVYRAMHPRDGEELDDFRALLAEGLVRPTHLEIWIMDADGGNKRQITDNGAANFAPFFHPGGQQIIFSSNLHEPDGRNFDLYLIGVDGTGLERITSHPEFDGFPMFSADGTKLVFASNRGAARPGDTNVFIADWIERVDRPANP